VKVLLDENVPHALRLLLVGHDVFTTQYMGWDGLKNGALLARATAEGFEAMVSLDAGLAHQHNSATLPIALVILHAPSADIVDVEKLIPDLLKLLSAGESKEVYHVPPSFC
jgi:hypothetical protein